MERCLKTSASISDLVYKSYIVEWVITLIKYINDLKGKIGEDAWTSVGKLQWKEGRRWIKENMSRLGIKGDDAETGAEVVRVGLQTLAPGLYTHREYKVLSKSPEKAIVEMSSWCPILEASEKLKMNPEIPMKYLVKEKLMGMLQTINPKLSVEFEDIKPGSSKCKIVIEIKE